MVIPYEQVLKEIEELKKKSPDGFSTSEMMAHTGHSDNWCRARIRELINAGKLKFKGKKSVERIDGATAYVPVYTFL
jgi:hypothetical protein